MSTSARMNQNSTLLCPFGIGYVQLMPHKIEDISEFDRVGSVRFNKRLVRFEHCALLFLVIHLFLHGLTKFQISRLALLVGGGALHMEELVEAETAQETTVAIIHIDRSQAALAELAKSQGDSRESPHEGRVHLFAIAEIDHKIPISALDHLLNKLLQTRAILEGPATFYLYPDGTVNAADLDGRCRVHTSGRNYPS
jgi:hypothetical protein